MGSATSTPADNEANDDHHHHHNCSHDHEHDEHSSPSKAATIQQRFDLIWDSVMEEMIEQSIQREVQILEDLFKPIKAEILANLNQEIDKIVATSPRRDELDLGHLQDTAKLEFEQGVAASQEGWKEFKNESVKSQCREIIGRDSIVVQGPELEQLKEIVRRDLVQGIELRVQSLKGLCKDEAKAKIMKDRCRRDWEARCSMILEGIGSSVANVGGGDPGLVASSSGTS